MVVVVTYQAVVSIEIVVVEENARVEFGAICVITNFVTGVLCID